MKSKITVQRASGPHDRHEREFAQTGSGLVAGVDEAGRGPWAGPVVAAAVILDLDNVPAGIDDSKLLSPKVRAALFDKIQTSAWVGVGYADVARIDRDNILNATFFAMTGAVAALGIRPELALVDGNRAPALPCRVETIVGGDAISLSIAAASIIAKVTRDCLMEKLAREFPGYGFERHKGYGTRAHAEALLRLGPSSVHRRSFRPVAAIFEAAVALQRR